MYETLRTLTVRKVMYTKIQKKIVLRSTSPICPNSESIPAIRISDNNDRANTVIEGKSKIVTYLSPDILKCSTQ
jgi:hypothetical protein